MGRRRFLPQGVLAVLAIAGVSCGLFEPDEPRVVPTTPPPPCRAPSHPDSVIANIVVHYAIGTDCYANQLADSVDTNLPGFHFLPDLQDSLEQQQPTGNPFEGWNKAVEISVTQGISSADTVLVYFDREYAGRVTSDGPPARETRFYDYRVVVANAPGDSTHYHGQAELTMVQVTSNWFLETFRDHRDASGPPTWGTLRAQNRR